MNDIQLRQFVIDELEFEPSIDATNIGVAAHDGIVTLTGYVRSYAEKVAALWAVRRVKGVRAVAQEIEVRYPGEDTTSDEEIAKRVLSVLKWHAMIPHDEVKVTVEKGWVNLGGTVDWHYQKKAVEDAIRKLQGVIGITNSISIKTSVQPADIKRKIEAALARSAQVEANAIRINVSNGNRVSLEGIVDSWEDHDIVENAAWSVPGVLWVDDRLTVSS
ncbi:BON domain-containing protein [Hyphomicrobium facile]|uniref:Osmotically-inducible protein OsmY, contains BON domain n=1 Tax=Hyphomicrobium facile TaxID=51670 RepID=A0A1I7NHR1_9HYPH|nr:BON domain-containing protein [Hyphomicrobium facile]SFV34205.1 Osmotically-inducible protein OsmY, contains BON domain [Hyphomicrobium facile]